MQSHYQWCYPWGYIWCVARYQVSQWIGDTVCIFIYLLCVVLFPQSFYSRLRWVTYFTLTGWSFVLTYHVVYLILLGYGPQHPQSITQRNRNWFRIHWNILQPFLHLFLWAIALCGIYKPYWHILSIKHPWSSEALLDASVLEVGNKKLKAP